MISSDKNDTNETIQEIFQTQIEFNNFEIESESDEIMPPENSINISIIVEEYRSIYCWNYSCTYKSSIIKHHDVFKYIFVSAFGDNDRVPDLFGVVLRRFRLMDPHIQALHLLKKPL